MYGLYLKLFVNLFAETINNVDIDISDSGKVIIPEDAVAREKVLQFLANVIVSSYLDDDSDYEAQATRRL